MKSIVKKTIYAAIGVFLPLIVLGVLYLSHSTIPLCDDLYFNFDSCDNDDSCYKNYNCVISLIPKTDVKCTYGGYIYYPGEKYCPSEYIFPYWLTVLCILIMVSVILIYVWFVFRYKCWQFMTDPWHFRPGGIQTKCKRCGKVCELTHKTACCGLCMGFGKISQFSIDIKDTIDMFDQENITINQMCPKCDGKGSVPTYEPYCEECDIPYMSEYYPPASVVEEDQPLLHEED